VEEIAGRDDGVEKGVRVGLLAPARGEVKDHRRIPCRRRTVLWRQQVALDDFHSGGVAVESARIERLPREAAHAAESEVEEPRDEPRPDEATGAGDQDEIVWSDQRPVEIDVL